MVWGGWRLLLCQVCILWFSNFVMKWFLLFAMNKSEENTLCDLSGNIFNLLNKLMQEYLLQHPIIFQISLFLCLKNCGTLGIVSPKCGTISHNGGKKRMINHYQCWMEHDLMDWITSRALPNLLFISCSVWFLQDSVLSMVIPRNLVWEKLGILLLL
jgi:hypothetical protein